MPGRRERIRCALKLRSPYSPRPLSEALLSRLAPFASLSSLGTLFGYRLPASAPERAVLGLTSGREPCVFILYRLTLPSSQLTNQL